MPVSFYFILDFGTACSIEPWKTRPLHREERWLMKQKNKSQPSETKVALILLLVGAAILGSLIWDWLQADRISVQIIGGASLAPGDDPEPSPPGIEPSGTRGTGDPEDLIPVYLVGAIKNPGVYQIIKGSYLYELVSRAGGLAEDAAVEQINLAFRIDTNQMICLPSLADAGEGAATISPDIYPSESSQGLIDINQATLEELDSLPGVGPSTAQAIISFREKNGLFASVEELMKIPGIKESRFNALKDLICVSG